VSDKRKALLTPASAVRRERVEWLWEKRIPLRAVSLLVGDPGLGKSMLACLIAARLSRQGRNSIFATAEDSVAAVAVPRLEAAGADLARITFVRMADEAGEDGLRLPGDTDELETCVAEEQAALVVIDPLAAHLPAEVNSWRDQSVRLALAPLHRMSERQGCATTVVAHLNKSLSSEPLRRIGGSIGLPAAARSALLLARDPDDPDGAEGTSRVLAQVKTNYGVVAPSLRFGIEPIYLPAKNGDPDVDTARLVEVGECEHGGEALLASRGDPEERSALDEAVAFLEEELGERTMDAKTVKRAARDLGISERTLDRAKQRAGVISERVGGVGSEGRWTWRLRAPERLANLEIGAHGGLSANLDGQGDLEDGQPLSSPSVEIGVLRAATNRNDCPVLGDEGFPELVLAPAVKNGRISHAQAEVCYRLHKRVAGEA
jgi:hypothetical protein